MQPVVRTMVRRHAGVARSRSDIRGWYWWALVATIVLVPSCCIALAVFFVSEGLENADRWASVGGFSVSVLVAAAASIGWLRQRAKEAGDLGTLDEAEPAADVEAARADRLAARVRQVWESEELRQRLLDPQPLPVSWRTLGPPVSDHWRVIGGDDTPVDLDGTLDDLYQTFHTKLPSMRLVALGEPGAGKTSLVMRFVLACLAARDKSGDPAAPVPVILRLSTWSPSDKSLRAWIYSRLREDYAFDEPLGTDRLLLVLDGLDEMRQADRETALTKINAAFGSTRPVLLTSRTGEYLATIDSREADVLTAAAVIELRPLDAVAVRDYLTVTTKPARLAEWDGVFAQLAAHPDGELARGLSTPLALSLARVTYAERAADPDDLLAFTSRREVEAHLLTQIVPALYSDPSGHPSSPWRANDVHRWLTFLARHFRTQGISGAALGDRVAPVASSVITGLVAGLGTGAAFGLAAEASLGAIAGTAMALGILGYYAFANTVPERRSQWGAWAAAAVCFAAVHWYLAAGDSLPAGAASGIAAVAALWVLTVLSPALIALQAVILSFAVTLGIIGGPAASPYALALAALAVVVFMTILQTSRTSFVVARILLAATGRLPWNVTALLEDGYQRGVFRKVGGLYYFRHDLLRVRLAHPHRS
ncbi:NACHT domain-containing protein [Nonomuraea sp. NPDC003201]